MVDTYHMVVNVNISGKWFVIKNYGVDDNGIIDYDEAEALTTT